MALNIVRHSDSELWPTFAMNQLLGVNISLSVLTAIFQVNLG